MANKRVFYASQAVAVGQSGGTATTVTGAQSVTMNTNFNIEQVFQLGRLAVYDNVVGDPSVEITVNKVLDGGSLLYTLAVGSGSIVNTANEVSKVVFVVGDDTKEVISDTDSADFTSITCDPIYLNSLSYSFSVDGDFTEEASFIGLSKVAGTSGLTAPTEGSDTTQTVLRRQNLSSSSVLPAAVSGANISSISFNADFGRESMYKLGQFKEFHRYVNFPLEISLDFEVIADSLDSYEVDVPDSACSGLNLPKEDISLVFCNSTGTDKYQFDFQNATLTSVAFNGGDTGGGNATLTYSYTVYNSFEPKTL
jgi:uncharacterized protein YjbI with pentapeptide repeats